MTLLTPNDSIILAANSEEEYSIVRHEWGIPLGSCRLRVTGCRPIASHADLQVSILEDTDDKVRFTLKGTYLGALYTLGFRGKRRKDIRVRIVEKIEFVLPKETKEKPKEEPKEVDIKPFIPGLTNRVKGYRGK